ncbi:hypothetical protein PG997_001477 [Apiospora hydei]|uniref:Metalloendopeptidase n=1 Tax=Apiospora hydei TaxID=1337664 RepID=A0ABR1XDT3_9PEZI
MARDNKSTDKAFPWKQDQRWPSSQRHLAVRFLNGTTEQKQLVKTVVKEDYNTIPMHIRFTFLRSHSTSGSDIRVKFTNSGRSWSLTGTTNREEEPHVATMALNLNGEKEEGKVGTILHEFGHALGLRHEHQHPDSGLVFNRRFLRQEWTDEYIQSQWLPYGIDKRRTEPYDRYSVMHYQIDKEETKNLRKSIKRNNCLSAGDKARLMAMYLEKEAKPKVPAPPQTTRATTIKKTRPPLGERSIPKKSIPTATVKYGGREYEYATEYTDRKGRKKKVTPFQQKLMQWILT